MTSLRYLASHRGDVLYQVNCHRNFPISAMGTGLRRYDKVGGFSVEIVALYRVNDAELR